MDVDDAVAALQASERYYFYLFDRYVVAVTAVNYFEIILDFLDGLYHLMFLFLR